MGAVMSKKTEPIQNNRVALNPAVVPPNPSGVTSSPAGVTSSPVEQRHNLQNGKPQFGGSRKKKIKFKRMKNKTNKKQKKSKSPK